MPQPGSRAAFPAADLRWALPLAAALCLAMVPTSVAAEEAAAEQAAANQANKPSLFMWGPQDIGIAAGYGHGFKIAHDDFQEGDAFSAFILLPHWQITLTRQPIKPSWYKGRLQFRAEATMIANFSPRSGFAGGLALLFRYSWNTRGSIRPWFQIGAGILGLDLDIESDQIDGFAFQPQGGGGAMWMIGGGHSIDFGVRYQHISNAYTRRPNGGIDNIQYTIGYAYHFGE